MVSAQRRKQLSDARAARQPRVKRQKLDTTPSENNEKENPSAAHSAAQSDLDQSEEDSYNGAWYWDRSSEEDISHSGKGKGNNREHVVEPNNGRVPNTKSRSRPNKTRQYSKALHHF